MPKIIGNPRQMSDGTNVIQYTDTVGASYVTYTLDNEQEALAISNKGLKPIVFSVGTYIDVTLNPGQKQKVDTLFTLFKVKSTQGIQQFEAWMDEAGTLGVSPEAMQSLDSKVSSFASELAEKATKEELSNIGDGSPKGTYATLTALQTAYPSGTTGIYVVTADGHWYYWSGSAWTDGGVYQSTGINESDPFFATKADKLVVDNIVKNSNFADATNWTFSSSATGSVLNNEATFTATAQLANVRQDQVATSVTGHKYYAAADVKAMSSQVQLHLYKYAGGSVIGNLITHSGSGNYERLSGVMEALDESVMSVRIIDYRQSAWDSISVKQFMLVDLTAIYGVGKEPTKAEFEEMLLKQNRNSKFVMSKLISNIVLGEISTKQEVSKSFMPLYIEKTGDVINAIAKYSDLQDLRVQLSKKGVNNIFNIYDLFLINNSSQEVSADISVGASMGGDTTDWLGPFVVLATNTIDGDSPSVYHFTGGNHGYDGGGTGSPTGRTTDIQLYVDGRKHNEFSGFAHYIDVYWSDMIQASNTKKADGTGREVLKVNYHIHYDGYKFEVNNNFELLEAATIITYYGIQASLPSWNDKVFFHSSANRKWNAVTGNPTSGTKTTNLATMKKGTNFMDIGIDNSIGIGDRVAITTTADGCFVSNNKAYFRLIDSKSFQGGDILSYKGYYRFYHKA